MRKLKVWPDSKISTSVVHHSYIQLVLQEFLSEPKMALSHVNAHVLLHLIIYLFVLYISMQLHQEILFHVLIFNGCLPLLETLIAFFV